jgi:gas vesicle protein
VATIAALCLLVGIGIGAAASSSSSKHPPTPAQLREQAEARTAQIHREEAEKAANERARVANEKKEAHERAVQTKETAHKEHGEAEQKRREEQKQRAEARRKKEEETKTYTGEGQQSLGTIVVPVASTVTWECPSCATAQEGAGANFIIENASSDENRIGVNSLKETHGVTPISAGTYHTVVVNTQAGSWTVHIAPGE